jgi:hypothetical protein
MKPLWQQFADMSPELAAAEQASERSGAMDDAERDERLARARLHREGALSAFAPSV